MENKRCACCKKWLSLEYFTKDKQKVDGLSPYCKECSRSKQKEYRDNLSEEQREKRRRYKREHKKRYNSLNEGYISLLKQVFKE